MSDEKPNREWEKQKLSATFFNIVGAGLMLGGFAQIFFEGASFFGGFAAMTVGYLLHRLGRSMLDLKEKA